MKYEKKKKLGTDKCCKWNVSIRILSTSKSFNLSKVYETSINSLGSYRSSYVDIKSYQDWTFDDQTKYFNILSSKGTLNDENSIE